MCLVDAITNPLSHVEPCTIPDGGNLPVLPLVDYYAASQVAVTVLAPATHPDAIGFLMYIGYGPSYSFYNITNASTTLTPGNYYLACIPITAAGAAIKDSASRGSSLVYQNAVTIIDNSLCKGYRLLAGGVQLLPVIETVTSTAGQYITKYYSACLCQRDLNRWFASTTSLVSLFEAARDFKSYSNCDGTCIRYDPLQYEKQLTWFTPVELTDIDRFNNDNLFWTCCYVEFATAITPVLSGSDYIYTFPVRCYSKLWLEGQLVQPSPIIGKLPSIDEHWKDILFSMKRMNDLFPCNTTGRSFQPFASKARKFYNYISSILQASSKLPIPGLNYANDVNNLIIKPIVNRSFRNGYANNRGRRNGRGRGSRGRGGKGFSNGLSRINNGSLPRNTAVKPIQKSGK